MTQKLLITLLALAAFFCLAAKDSKSRKTDVPAKKTKVLILTGMEHPAHNWKTRTIALQDILALDPRFEVAVEEDPRISSR